MTKTISNGVISPIQRELLKEKCPHCKMGNLRAVGENDNDQEANLWCDTCDCSIQTDGSYTI